MKKLLAIALIGLLDPSLVAAQEGGPDAGEVNLLVTVTVADVDPGGHATRRSARVLALAGSWVKLATGWKVPIPRASLDAAGAGGSEPPLTTYSYQDVGLSASLQGQVVGDGGVRLRGQVEVSAIDPPGAASATAAPRFATFTHDFRVLLDDGVEAVLAEVPAPEGGSTSFTISAAIGGEAPASGTGRGR